MLYLLEYIYIFFIKYVITCNVYVQNDCYDPILTLFNPFIRLLKLQVYMFNSMRIIYNTVILASRYHTVQNNTVLHTALQWLEQDTDENSNSLRTPHISLSRASYWVSIVSIVYTVDRIISGPHCTDKCMCYWDNDSLSNQEIYSKLKMTSIHCGSV